MPPFEPEELFEYARFDEIVDLQPGRTRPSVGAECYDASTAAVSEGIWRCGFCFIGRCYIWCGIATDTISCLVARLHAEVSSRQDPLYGRQSTCRIPKQQPTIHDLSHKRIPIPCIILAHRCHYINRPRTRRER